MAIVHWCAGWLTPRRVLISTLAASWAVLIGASAGRAADGETWLGLPNMDALLYVFLAFLALNTILFVVALIMARGVGGPSLPRRKKSWPLLILVMLMLMFALGQSDNIAPLEDDREEPIAVENEDGDESTDEPGTTPSAGVTEFGILVAMLVVAAGVLLAARRFLPAEPEELDADEDLETVLGPAMARAAGRLLSGTDPRSAVLAAYAELELTMADAGLPPDAHETPVEHLTRVLRQLPVSAEPLLELAELYQLARFSTQEITEDQQRRAADALERAQAAMAVTA